MLSFIRYKSKEFIFLISLYSGPSKSKRYLSQLQTKVFICNNLVEYNIHEKRHREEKDNGRVLPARIYRNGDQYWYKNGKWHRNDRDENGRVLPAIIYNNECQFWCKNGKVHRDDLGENGKILPAIIKSNGSQEYWINGTQRHRIVAVTYGLRL